MKEQLGCGVGIDRGALQIASDAHDRREAILAEPRCANAPRTTKATPAERSHFCESSRPPNRTTRRDPPSKIVELQVEQLLRLRKREVPTTIRSECDLDAPSCCRWVVGATTAIFSVVNSVLLIWRRCDTFPGQEG